MVRRRLHLLLRLYTFSPDVSVRTSAQPLCEHTEAPLRTAQVYGNEQGMVVHDAQSEGEDTEDAEEDDSEGDEEDIPETENIRVGPILLPAIYANNLCLCKG